MSILNNYPGPVLFLIGIMAFVALNIIWRSRTDASEKRFILPTLILLILTLFYPYLRNWYVKYSPQKAGASTEMVRYTNGVTHSAAPALGLTVTMGPYYITANTINSFQLEGADVTLMIRPEAKSGTDNDYSLPLMTQDSGTLVSAVPDDFLSRYNGYAWWKHDKFSVHVRPRTGVSIVLSCETVGGKEIPEGSDGSIGGDTWTKLACTWPN